MNTICIAETMKLKRENIAPIYHFFAPQKRSTNDGSVNDFYATNLPQRRQIVSPKIEQAINQETAQEKELKRENERLKLELQELQSKNQQLIKENTKYKNDLVQMRKLYNTAFRTYVKKDMQIKLLEKKVVSTGLIFDAHKNELGEKVLKKLRMLGGDRKSDSTFVLKCVRRLYESNHDKLKKKSITGSADTETITPEKKQIIEQLFFERLSNERIEEDELQQRLSRLNNLLNSAIHNIQRSVVNKTPTSKTKKPLPSLTRLVFDEPPPLVAIESTIGANVP